MKKISVVFALLATLFSASFAQAQMESPLWSCGLTFQAKGGGVHLLIGHYELNGQGEITCQDTLGNVEVIPVRVRLGGQPVGLKLGVGYMELAGIATGVGLAASPWDLLGMYVVGGVHGAIGVGAGAQLALHGADRALTLNASLQAVRGAGVNLGFDFLEISPL